MKHFLSFAFITLALAACTDTTGLSPETSRTPHPGTNANAAVVVVEYADFECPACRGAQHAIIKPMLEKYGSQIRYEFHHFPLASIHRYAMEAAEAAECAADQGKFWEFVDYSYEHQEELSRDALDMWGEVLGLDTALYDRCRASHIKRDLVQSEYTSGKALGVGGTPTFFVNGVKVENKIDAIGAAIEAALGNAGANL